LNHPVLNHPNTILLLFICSAPPPPPFYPPAKNTARLSPLIKAQPKPFVDANGVNQGYVVVYKDEGGKYAYHYTMRVSVPTTTRTVSVAAYAQCRNPACSQHHGVLPPPQFVSEQIFHVRECGRARYKGPLPRTSTPVHAWREKANVWSYKTFMDDSIVIKCNFLKVTSKCMCGACGGETQFKIAVSTDNNCVDTSLPICVMSKRKIPASMRKKSQREIEAFMDKTRNKKAVQAHKRKGAAAVRLIQKKFSKPAQPAKRKRLSSVTELDIDAMTFAERTRYIEMQDISIKEMSTKIDDLKANLEKKEKLLAALEQQKANKRQKFNANTDDNVCITPCTNFSGIDATPPTSSFLPADERVAPDPFSLYDDDTTGNLPGIEEEFDWDNWVFS